MEQKIKVFLFGLDNAGKTSLVKYLKEERVDENQSPTREFDVIKLAIENQNMDARLAVRQSTISRMVPSGNVSMAAPASVEVEASGVGQPGNQ